MVLAKLGPCGGHGGIYQDLHPEGVIRISKLIIHHGRAIFGINICFERENGEKVWTRRHGGIGTAFSEVFLGKNENITGITGTCGMIDNDRVITSISFHTDTGKIFGPFGYEEGFQWQLRAPGGKIVGFFVNSGSKLDSIGIHAYYNESPNVNSASVSKLGPCGGLGGQYHDLCTNGVSRVNKLIVHHGDAIFGINVQLQLGNGEKVWTGRKGGTGIMSNEIVLGKDENIIGVSGTTGLKDNFRVVRSIAFHTDKDKFFGPYGNEEISEWQLYAPPGGKIVGFFVRTGGLLDSVGIYVRSIFVPHVICSLKTLKVAFRHSTNEEVVIHSVRLPNNSTVGDVLTDLKTKVELSRPDAELRLLEVYYHKIYKIFLPADRIENINDQYWTLRAEEISEDEANLDPNDRLIHVYHFMKDPHQNEQVQNFGEPFLLAIREGEVLGEVKIRIQKKLQVTDEEFAKWKFAFLSLGRPDYLKDTDIVSSRFQRNNVYGAWEQYLGLEHTETTPKRA